jgi:LemA protein
MTLGIIIALAFALVLVVLVVLAYNGLVGKRNRSANAWAQVDVQLRRRYDLIPNLVESVKGYAAHEEGTFTAVTEARAAAQQADGPAAQAEAEATLSGALGRLLAVAEAYPALRATENFQQLQDELGGTENRIATSRQVYNDTVLTYNNACQQVPTNIVAGMFGFQTREYFEVQRGDAAREPVAVSF